MRITIDIDTDHPEAFDTLRADLEGMLGHTDEHGPRATWVQIRESVYEGTNVRREWTGEGPVDEHCDCGDMACEHPDHRETAKS